MQPKLLRFLDNSEGVFTRRAQAVHMDVRVIAATHRELAERVCQRRFREELPIHIPPLRERQADTALLARHFARELSAGGEPPVFAPDAPTAVLAHPWRQRA